jgi:hypothetical protein
MIFFRFCSKLCISPCFLLYICTHAGFYESLLLEMIFDTHASLFESFYQIVAITSALLVRSAFFYTGGFYQPLLAFIRTFGCFGVYRPGSRFTKLTKLRMKNPAHFLLALQREIIPRAPCPVPADLARYC